MKPNLPHGWHSLVPRIVVDDVDGMVDFLRRAFDANADVAADRPAMVRIGDSVVMVSGVGPRPAMTAFLYVYVADADATYGRAIDAGARSLETPRDTPYGDRRAMIEDAWGNVFQIATPLRAPAADPLHGEFGTSTLAFIGYVRSSLSDKSDAPMQGSEGAPEAWLDLEPNVADAIEGLKVGDDVILITWLHLAERDTLMVHPRDDAARPLTGVFATRSPDRPNPLGLHAVRVLEIDGSRLRVGPLEAIDGTPVVDIKPAL